jgi:serine phosphatase RsbU (regulator of sigma subunit)
VFEQFAADEYATLLVLLLDPASGTVRWASAGHPAPVITGPPPRQVRFDGSLPVGLFPEAEHASYSFQLEPGQAVLLYTDGVVEARSRAGEQLGVEGLLTAVPPPGGHAAQVAETVLDAVVRHTRGRLDDDAALLVIGREG